MNPNDNQGAKVLLLICLLGGKQDEKVDALLKKYQSDKSMVWWNYFKAWVCFRRQGENNEAGENLK